MRDTLTTWLEFIIGGLIAFALAGAAGLLVAADAQDKARALDDRLRAAESKLSDVAFTYRCPDCDSVLIHDWHVGAVRCTGCGVFRRFAGVTVHDPEKSRGWNDRPRLSAKGSK